MAEELHDLTAAYALDALAGDEARAYEAHLRDCTRCQQELASLSEAANALAYAVDGPDPPPDLRERILEAARKERQTVVPFPSRRVVSFAWGAAAAAATVAIAVGAWAANLASDLQAERSARADRDRALAVLGDADAERIPVDGRDGTLVVRRTGEAVLIAALDPAPDGKTYEAWVIVGGTPRPAGVFDVSDGDAVHLLTRPVPDGAVVAVTVEPDGGVERPTGSPVLQTGRA